MTPEMAPDAPTSGTVDPVSISMWVVTAARPQTR